MSVPGVQLRPATGGDLPALSGLFAQGFGRPLGAAEWEWKYHQVPGEARSVVAVTPGGELMAHAGALALPARWAGRGRLEEGSAWQLCDFVGRRASLRAPLVAAGRALLEGLPRSGDLPWIYGFPSARHLALGERTFGYRPLPWIEVWEGELAAVPSPAIPPPLVVGDRPAAGVESAWARCGGQGVRRTPAFLAWRYTARPERYYRFYSLGPDGADGLVVVAFAGEVAQLAEVWLPPGLDGEEVLRAVAADLRALGLLRWRSWPLAHGNQWLPALGLRPSGEQVPLGCRPRGAGSAGEQVERIVAAAAGLYYPMGDHDLV